MRVVDHTDTIISLRNVSFRYGNNQVIERVSLNVHRGDYLGVIGPNGGGKTTLIKLILGLLQPQIGLITLFGKEISDFKDWYKIGYVPQKATAIDQNFPVTVEEVVAMGTYARRGLFHQPTGSDRKLVQKALDNVEMLNQRKTIIGDLSGGQQQRVIIARALAAQPEMIFLDEPTAGVDIAAQEEFYQLLRKLNQQLELTLVFVSHELDIVAREATEIAIVNKTLTYYSSPKVLEQKGRLASVYGKGLNFSLKNQG